MNWTGWCVFVGLLLIIAAPRVSFDFAVGDLDRNCHRVQAWAEVMVASGSLLILVGFVAGWIKGAFE